MSGNKSRNDNNGLSTGKISTGQYENMSPFFSFTEKYNRRFTDEQKKEIQSKLHDLCYAEFNKVAEMAYQEKIAKTYQNIRWYDGADGKKYPSVTSIIGIDEDFHVPPDELAQYAARGTIIDKQVEIFLKTKEWKEPKEIPEIYPDFATLKGGNLGLVVDDVDFVSFYLDYPFKVLDLQPKYLNHEYQYGGRGDIKCVIESANKGKWDKIEGVLFDVPTIFDVKSGQIDKTKHFKQQTAYWKCDSDVKQVGLIPLTKENKCGYAKPRSEEH